MRKFGKMLLLANVVFGLGLPTASAGNSSFSLSVTGGNPSVYTDAVKKTDWDSAVVNIHSDLGGWGSGVDMRIRTDADYGNGREKATGLVSTSKNGKYYLSYYDGYGTKGKYYRLYMSREGLGTNHVAGVWAP